MNASESEEVAPPARYLFHHIPKTAGTSLNTLLGGVFGESNFLHLPHGTMDGQTPARLAALVADPDGPVCIAGHIPVHYAGAFADQVIGFTLLRHPVERILSQHKFLRDLPAPRRVSLGVPDGYTLEQFLAARVDEVILSVDNGMCRFLSGVSPYNNPRHADFWEHGNEEAILSAALASLARLHFGIFERMADSLALLRGALEIPFEAAMPHRNATDPRERTTDTALLAEIERRNALDLRLYEEANRLFAARLAQPRPAPAPGLASRALFRPAAGTSYPTPDIPGRQGFLPAEAGGLAWADETVPLEIVFQPQTPILRFRLHVLMITPDYPIETLRAALNDQPVPVAVLEPRANQRRTLRIGPFSARAGLNRLRLFPPAAVPVRSVRPGTDDRRNLSIGLLQIDAL